MPRYVLVALFGLALPACASALQAFSPAPHTISGTEFLAIDAAVQAERLDRSALQNYEFAVVRNPDQTWEVGIDRSLAPTPGRKRNGSPTGRGVVYVVSDNGTIIRRYYAR